MAILQDIIRLITIRGKTEGVEQTTSQLRNLAGAQGEVAGATEKTERATISLESRLRSIERQVDAEARSEQQLTRIHRDLQAARDRGLISVQRQNELLTLSAKRYAVESESVKKATEQMRLFREVGAGFVGGLGAGLLAGGIMELPTAISEAVEKLGNTANVADTIGLTTKALQELRYAARLSDVDVGTLDEAMTKFSTNLAKNGGPLQKIFEINKQRISGDVLTDLKTYADLIKNASNQEERNQLTGTAFGKSAQEMGRLFDEGSAGIQHWADEAEHAGAVISDDKIQRARNLNDQMEALKPRLEAAQAEFAVMVAPLEVALLEQMASALKGIESALDGISSGKAGATLALLMKLATGMVPGGFAGIGDQLDNAGKDLDRAIGNINKIVVPGGTTAPTAPIPRQRPWQLDSDPGPHTKLWTAPDHSSEQQAKAIKSVTDALNLQIKNLTATNREQFINNQLSQAHVTSASKEGKAIADLAAQYYDEKQAIDAANQASEFFATTTESAFEGLITGSKSVVDSMLDVAKAIATAVMQAELLGSGPLSGILGTESGTGGPGGILGTLFSGLLNGLGGGGGIHLGYNLNALGGAYSSAGLSALSGSVVDRPVVFPFAKGGALGVAGEAGPEAIMPLRRGSDGRLGVSAPSGAGGKLQIAIALSLDAGGNLVAMIKNIAGAEADVRVSTYDRQMLPSRVQAISSKPHHKG